MTEAAQSRFKVGGMDCAACALKIETAVMRIPGVTEATASYTAGTLRVAHGSLATGAVERAITALGYTVGEPTAMSSLQDGPAQHDHDHDHHHDHGQASHNHADAADGPWWQGSNARLALACAVALGVAYAISLALPTTGHWAFLAALVPGLVPISRRALAGVVAGTPFSIETLMTIAAVGAVIIGATEEAAVVVVLFLVGELLEGVAAARARRSIRGLIDLVPKLARVERNGVVVEIAADALGIGDVLVARPGDRIAADGTVLDGTSSVDEAPVTGESIPSRKMVGDQVFAGTINIDAVLRIVATATAADNTIARVVRLVEEAQESKAPTERFIDRFSRIYTPAVLIAGTMVATLPPLLVGAAWDHWIYKGLAVLLIGCPCALVISTPAAIAAGLAAGARNGLLLKGGAVLEGLRRVTTIAFDKTGTLTEGRPVVTDIVPVGRSRPQVLALAAALEAGSAHPLASAILAAARTENAPVPPASSVTEESGAGVSGMVGGEAVFLGSPRAAGLKAVLPAELEARISAFTGEGKTASVLVVGDRVAGIIAMRDEPRADAAVGLAALRRNGLRTVMLTGDNERTAAAIGRSLGLEVHAGLMPADKQRIVRTLQATGQVVAKVGDGINDAPALAAADFGIAMGGGTDVALETADAAVLRGHVADIAGMIALSHTVMRNIGQNITIALGLKAVFLVTTILGVTGLWPAILADTGATVLVTANAMRLLRWKPR